MSLSRRDFFGLFGGAGPKPTAAPAVVVTAEVQARAAAFRAQLAARSRGGDDAPRVAVITPRLCLLHLGTTCSTCVEVCPEPGALTVRGRAVELDAARCTGCGRCAERCPAPVPALAMRAVTP